MKYYSICGSSFSKLFERGFIMGNLVEVKNNQVVTTSRQVAQNFKKQHKDVLEVIRGILAAENSATKFYHQTTFTNRGKKYPEYYMNRDGFSLLVMGFTGQKALQWKIKYIQAFNKMEEDLKQKTTAPAPVFPQCLWQGQVVMPASYIVSLTGISGSALMYTAKRRRYSFFMLQGEELRKFKEKNRMVNNSSCRMILYPYETVMALLEQRNLYEKHAAFLQQYFNQIPQEGPTVSCYTEALGQEIQGIQKELVTLDTMLNNLMRHKRKVREHEAYFKICTELAVGTLQRIVSLKAQSPLALNEHKA